MLCYFYVFLYFSTQSLEEEGVAERRRLAALHQQRVLAHLAQRRRTALTCYTRSLRDTPPNVSFFYYLIVILNESTF